MMNKIFLLIILSFFTISAFGQSENSKQAAENFEKSYNFDDYDAIFSSFSVDMQNALPYNETKEFLESIKQQAGKILKKKFLRYEQSYASYKTTFEKALLVVNISIDDHAKINGLLIKPYVDNNFPKPERNTTKLILPFDEEWDVVWGGDTKELNYHVENEAQKNAIDVIIKDETGKSFKTDGKTNDDYYAFGQRLIAPCDGEIVLVVDGIKDNTPGIFNPYYVPGNTVILKTCNEEYLFFAHFKQHSIVIKQGQRVKQGELLGLCGNSGNSSEPHLHFHIQNIENMTFATGIKCYFDTIQVHGEVNIDYSPVKGDKIRSLNRSQSTD